MGKMKVTPIEEVNWGIYVWQMPDETVVMDEDGNELNCHMGGKFRGRNKRQNIVEKGKWLLVGLREWEKTHKNCDLEYVYDA